MSHSSNTAAEAAFPLPQSETHSPVTGDRTGLKPGHRAKSLGKPNPLLLQRRKRVAVMLARLFGAEKQTVRAAAFGVSATYGARWLSDEERVVNKNPAPLAMLLALDEESYQRVLAELAIERAAEREGR